MKSILFGKAGEPVDVLRFEDVADPRISDGHVLVKVACRPIHPADLAFIRGQYRVRPNLPQVAGLEGAGVIVGSQAGSTFVTGSRVAFRHPGSWAELACVPLERLIAVPPGVTDEAACQISLNPMTALGLLDQAKAAPGDWILLTAATSTVANLVASIARRRGINVIGLVRGDAADNKSRTLADHVISTSDPDLASKIKAMTDDRGADGLLDSVGGPGVTKLFAMLAPGAHVVAYGVQDREPAAVTNAMLIYSNLTWTGFGIDRWLSECLPAAKAKMIDELWSMVEDKLLPLPVASTHGLDQFREALAADARQGRTGKVLLVS
jgi:NADPH:quinone reductase-like Zn-dependent oxidoreductase